MMPPGGATVMNPHGKNLSTPAFVAAVAKGIWSVWSRGPTAEMTISISFNATTRSVSGPMRSAVLISTPRSLRAAFAGLETEEGRVRATIDFDHLSEQDVRQIRTYPFYPDLQSCPPRAVLIKSALPHVGSCWTYH